MKGHIRERSPGKWAIILDAKDAAGRRKRRWHSFAGTKRAAQIECARLIAEAQHGGAVDSSRVTVSEYIDRFLTDWASLHVTAGSAQRYAQALEHVRRHLGDRRLQALRASDLAGLYAGLVRGGLNPKTARLIHSVTFQALKQAKVWGLLRDNIAESAEPPKVINNHETAILQPEQARKLLEAVAGHELYMIASLGLSTGMRRNEMLGLLWEHVKFDAGTVTIKQALEGNRGTRVKGPKTRNSRRTISLPAHTVAELRAHWKTQQEQRMAVGLGRSPDDGFVLAGPDGKAQSPGAVSKAWERTMSSIGMPEITLHSLRHTHASMLIASGIDVLTISKRLGHSSPAITLGVYGHLIHGSDERAAAIMSESFGKIG
jgi:integrase